MPSFGNGVNGTHIYEDTLATASRSGFTLHMDNFDWDELYPGKEWATWSKVRLSGNRYNYVFPNGDILLKSTIRRVAGLTEPREHEWLSKMFAIPNSQVKNFLNACRGTFGNFTEEMSILVIGSKAREGTGLWTKLFALYVLGHVKKVEIDFIDPAERPQYWEYELDGRKVTCSWLVGLATPEMAQDYDVVIDDSWVGGVSSIGYDFKKGSIKGRGELFLHPKEHREFKSEVSSYKSPCPCLLCGEIAKCVSSYEEYQSLRLFCTRLGHMAPCSSAFFSTELNIVSRFIKTLLTTGTVELTTNAMLRGLLSVMEEIPTDIEKGVVRLGEGNPKFSDITRFKIKVLGQQKSSAPHLDGKKVIFVGVSPTVVTGVDLKKVGDAAMHTEKGVDAIFVQNRRLWSQVTSTPYCPRSIYVPDDGKSFFFPGWNKAKHRVGEFQEYVREIESVKNQVQIGQYCRGELFDPVIFSPVLDVSNLGFPLIPGEVKGDITFWKVENFVLEKVVDPTFEEDLGRMISVDCQGHWQSIFSGSSGRISFGENRYSFLHPAHKVFGKDKDLLVLIKKAQNGMVTEKEFNTISKGTKELLTVAGLKKNKKGAKFRVKFYYCQNIPPFFLISALEQLSASPVLSVVDHEPTANLESAWAQRVALEAVTHGDEKYGKGLLLNSEKKGVKMKCLN